MATIKTTPNQEKTIDKVNHSIAELEKINSAISTLNNGGCVHYSVDIEPRGKGRGRTTKEYTGTEKTGKIYKAVLSALELRRSTLKKEINGIVAKNEWLSLNEHEQNVLRGKVTISEAKADNEDAAQEEDNPETTETETPSEAEVEDPVEEAAVPEPDAAAHPIQKQTSPRRAKSSMEDFDAMLAKANADAASADEDV